LIKDFASFTDRPVPIDEINDPLSGHLYSLRGKKWHTLREKLSPAFSPRRVKAMFPIIRRCAKVLENYLTRNLNEGVNVFEFRELSARYNTNVISSVAFGIENDCINDPDNIFRKMCEKHFESNFTRRLKEVFLISGCLKNYLKLKLFEPNVEKFMIAIFKQTVDYREANNFTRNDFMQLLIQLKNKGCISTSNQVNDESFYLNLNEITAQACLFFLAGYETTNQTLSFCLFEIVKNPDIQEKIYDEIDNAMFWSDDKVLSYEMVDQMRYLDCCVEETLRKYAILPFVARKSTKSYKINDMITIPKGTCIYIPTLGLHRDPEIFENPLEFRPERFFGSSNGKGISKGVFNLSTGAGPRNCIGAKLGKVTVKICLILIISKFKLGFKDLDIAKEKLLFHPMRIFSNPIKDVDLKLSFR
jgi:cytochrome P450 family 6